jgi:hypothetical protein
MTISELRDKPLENVAAVHTLDEVGIETLTLTLFVDSKIGLGSTITLAPEIPAILRMSLATLSASAKVAPGTITHRAAS